MLLAIVLFPLGGALLNAVLSASGMLRADHKREHQVVSVIACCSILISALLSTYLFLFVLNPAGLVENSFTWIVSGDLNVRFGFLFDNISAVMALVITWVGFLIHLYSVGYMHNDNGYSKYFIYLNIFVFFMLVLVLGNNFPLMFVGWEGVGLSSYLLIGFWYTDDEKAFAGRKAFVVNRIGDFGFLIAIFLIFFVFGSLDYSVVFSQALNESFMHNIPAAVITAIALLLFVGAVGKSAQFPLYVWLPDAMAGPTPVSALIHAATMVTAGVYMVTRCSVFFSGSPVAQFIVVTIAVFTAFFAATIALSQTDIKKVLAYSTVSQLGYMFMGVGVGAYAAGMFHLVTHAFFKALLFLGAGSVIHALHEEQDIRKMGGLREYLPITSKTFLAGTLAISGLPLLSGFFSKDQILGELYERGYTLHWLVAVITAFLTALYMMRLYFVTFEGVCRVPRNMLDKLHESPRTMTIPLIVLAILSVVGGYIGIPDFIGAGFGFNHINLFKEFIWGSVTAHEIHEASHHFIGHWTLLLISVFIVITAILIAYYLYIIRPEKVSEITSQQDFNTLYKGSNSKWYIDELYENSFIALFRELSRLSMIFDAGFVDNAVNGMANYVYRTGELLRKFQSGLLRYYAAVMTVGAILVVVIMLFY